MPSVFCEGVVTGSVIKNRVTKLQMCWECKRLYVLNYELRWHLYVWRIYVTCKRPYATIISVRLIVDHESAIYHNRLLRFPTSFQLDRIHVISENGHLWCKISHFWQSLHRLHNNFVSRLCPIVKGLCIQFST